MNKSNMYQASVCQWNPFVGCGFECTYCKRSFQQQQKRRGKKNCPDCYNYKPHKHPARLEQRLPNTGFGQFIFTCASGDIAFCDTDYLGEIVDRIRREEDKTFLIQSKNPKTFGRINWPGNVILGTTIETENADLCKQVSKTAPAPEARYKGLLAIDHPLKMVTIEPVMKFDLGTMVKWVEEINPALVWIGFDTKNTGLTELDKSEAIELLVELSRKGVDVRLKRI
jgi:DNA repair photolyase